MQSEVVYLGYVIYRTGLHPDKGRIQAITEAPRPENVTELKAYLGLLSYYGTFLQNLSTAPAPLHRLLRKRAKWSWSCEQERGLSPIKTSVSVSQSVSTFRSTARVRHNLRCFVVRFRSVLAQKGNDVKEHPVAFGSRTLTKAERNYAQVEREALAVILVNKGFTNICLGESLW